MIVQSNIEPIQWIRLIDGGGPWSDDSRSVSLWGGNPGGNSRSGYPRGDPRGGDPRWREIIAKFPHFHRVLCISLAKTSPRWPLLEPI